VRRLSFANRDANDYSDGNHNSDTDIERDTDCNRNAHADAFCDAHSHPNTA
jgi:hypothetical protein